MKKVVIIGAGITGLSAAYTIQEEGRGQDIDYLLIEKENRLGGKIYSEKVDGFIVEGGPDCFLADKPSVAQLCSQLGIEDAIIPSNEASKRTYVLNKGKLCELPEGLMSLVPTKIIPFALSPLVSWPGKIRMALDLVIPKKKADSDESLASFVRRRLGEEALDKIAEPLIGGIHAGDPEKMSLKATFPRFLQMEQNYGSMMRAMLAGRKNVPSPKKTPTIGGKPKTFFMTFNEGMSQLTDAVAAKLDSEKVIMGKAVTKLERMKNEQGQYIYQVNIDGMPAIEADAVILATPAYTSAKLMADVDNEIAETLSEIPLVSSATVNLAYKKSDLKDDLQAFGLVIPRSEKRKIMAVTYSSTKWNNRTPDENYVVFRAFVGGARNQEYAELADEKMLALVRDEIKDIMGIAAEPVLSKIYRWQKGMPQYTMGHLERIDTIEKKSDQLKGIYIVGGAYRGVGVPDCVNAGTGAAKKALEFLS